MNLAPSGLVERRLAAVREAAKSAGCDALLVTRRANIFYLSNFAGSAGALVVTPGQAFLLLDSRYTAEAARLLESPHSAPGVSLVPVESSYDETIVEVAASAHASVAMPGLRLGFEADDVSFARHAWLQQRIAAGVTLRPTRGLVEGLREVKDEYERGILRAAARALAAIAAQLEAKVIPGRTEREVAWAIEAAMRSSGFSKPAFDTIVASGPNGALPHATAGDRIIEAGDLVVVDFGGVWDGYCVDMSRTLPAGSAGAEARRVHAAVLAAQRASIAAVRPGVLTGDIDRAARAVLEEAGLGDAFGHATGHGLGIELHEEPRITRRRPSAEGAPAERAPGMVPVVPGMVFTIEPGAYLPGWGGVRIEDDVLVTEDGCEVLTGSGGFSRQGPG